MSGVFHPVISVLHQIEAGTPTPGTDLSGWHLLSSALSPPHLQSDSGHLRPPGSFLRVTAPSCGSSLKPRALRSVRVGIQHCRHSYSPVAHGLLYLPLEAKTRRLLLKIPPCMASTSPSCELHTRGVPPLIRTCLLTLMTTHCHYYQHWSHPPARPRDLRAGLLIGSPPRFQP